MMFKKLSIYAFAFVGAIMVLSSCEKEYESIETIDGSKLEQYIASNNLQVTKDPSGFYYQIANPGTGDKFTNKDSVLYHFVIKSLSGTVFYDTHTDAENIGTLVGYSDRIIGGKSVPALRTAIQNLSPGGAANVFLPSQLAYGRNGETSINVPSNEPLIFAVTTLPERSQEERDENLIKAFLTRNNLNATRDISGVYYIIKEPGKGTAINIGSTIYPLFTGRLLDGTEFETSADTSAASPLTSRLPGWQLVLPKISSGGKMRLIIPSKLAYGAEARSLIKMNSVLDYDVEVRKVTN
jgi:FKBP-type peptidyl-prolyl cis-trans isomerase FkpA